MNGLGGKGRNGSRDFRRWFVNTDGADACLAEVAAA